MKKWLALFGESVVVFCLVFLLTVTNLFSSFDYIATDRLYQQPRGITSQIKIIGIDEDSLEALGPIQNWTRQVYADLIMLLNSDKDAKPMLICFDILFSGHLDGCDDAFVKQAEKSGNVISVCNFSYSDRLQIREDGYAYHPIQDVYMPYDELADVVKVGYSNMSQDSDGIVRRINPSEEFDGEQWEMFPELIYKEYCARAGVSENTIPTDKYGMSLINYSGKPGDYEYIPIMDILDGKIDTRTFKDSIVLVGAYAPGMQDNFKVPNGGSKQMYGVEVHANILQSYMDNRFSVNGNPYLFGALFGLVAALLHILFRKCKLWMSILFLIAGVAAEVFVCHALNESGTCVHIIYMPLVCALSFIYALGMRYIFERLKRKKVVNAFKKYVAPEVVEEISKQGDFTIKLGGELRDVAVLFVDIRGFTTMSEALEPEQVVSILNEYLNLTTNCIFKNKGTLDKFVGDATMAVFNSPFDLEDYEYKAVCAALDIVHGGQELEKELMEKYGRSVGFGVGVNCGPAVVGNIGCEFRMDYTAIGDTVNTAARLEANAKKGQVLISDVLYERLKDRLEVNEVGEIPLKGKSNHVFVYEVVKAL